MKEKELDNHLDNIVIEGLIKEAEQDSAEFAEAMRRISDEEFADIVGIPAYAACASMMPSGADESVSDEVEEAPVVSEVEMPAYYASLSDTFEAPPVVSKKRHRIKPLLPWLAAAVSAAAIVLIVLIPSLNTMDAKLCESALYMSEEYITAPKGGFDISSATDEQIRNELPALEKRFADSYSMDFRYMTTTGDFRDAGWTLAVAYLKLHKKGDAVKVLRLLASQSKGTPFGNHCEELLKTLE